MPVHGFARYGQFEIIAIDENGFTAELQPDEASTAAYPFNYRFTARYIFGEVSFKVYLRLDNLGDEPIPWSAGHHFYFNLPGHSGLTRSDYRFDIPAKKCLHTRLMVHCYRLIKDGIKILHLVTLQTMTASTHA